MVFGPYADDWGDQPVDVQFRLAIDVIDGDDLTVVTLDVYDADTDDILAGTEVRRSRFETPARSQPFSLAVDLAGRAGHRIETRVFWHDIAEVRVGPVVVSRID